ncbi:MAG: hypothetical protein R3B13_32520 [Polyangiaceae bacterium]
MLSGLSARIPLQGAASVGRRSGIVLHLVLAILAGLLAFDPGALARIRSQSAGKILIVMLSCLALVAAGFALVRMMSRTTALDSEATDAVLHVSMATIGFGYGLFDGLFTTPPGASLLALLGLALLLGAGTMLWSVVRTGPGSDRRSGIPWTRDLVARGLVLLVLGGMAVDASGLGPMTSGDAWLAPKCALVAAALLAYALHTKWVLTQHAQAWARGAY